MRRGVEIAEVQEDQNGLGHRDPHGQQPVEADERAQRRHTYRFVS